MVTRDSLPALLDASVKKFMAGDPLSLIYDVLPSPTTKLLNEVPDTI